MQYHAIAVLCVHVEACVGGGGVVGTVLDRDGWQNHHPENGPIVPLSSLLDKELKNL